MSIINLTLLPATGSKVTVGTGFSSTYLVNRNLGVRFTADYDVAPPLVSSSCEAMHKLTLGMTESAMF